MTATVLVVDDSMLVRHTVCRWLEERGFQVEAVSNGAEALEAVERKTPDLIITDLEMPRMTGSQLLSAVKSRPRSAHVPVVVLSSRQSARVVPLGRHPEYTIHKDIDIEQQLERAVTAVLGDETVPRQ